MHNYYSVPCCYMTVEHNFYFFLNYKILQCLELLCRCMFIAPVIRSDGCAFCLHYSDYI